MSELSEQMRSRAEDFNQQADELLQGGWLKGNAKKEVAIVVAKVSAHVYQSMAQLAEFLEDSGYPSPLMQLRRRMAEQNRKVRDAAADAVRTGNWDKFNRIVAGQDTGGEPPPEN